jgi:hypothetical protein
MLSPFVYCIEKSSAENSLCLDINEVIGLVKKV